MTPHKLAAETACFNRMSYVRRLSVGFEIGVSRTPRELSHRAINRNEFTELNTQLPSEWLSAIASEQDESVEGNGTVESSCSGFHPHGLQPAERTTDATAKISRLGGSINAGRY